MSPPPEVLTLGKTLRGLCSDEQRVWVTDAGPDVGFSKVLALKLP